MSESEIEQYKEWCKENMAKKILEKRPNTFSILYRSGEIEKEPGPRIIEADGTPSIENTNIGLTGKFTEDISDYFKNRLIEGGVDITDEISIRTSALSWTIYFEVYNGLVQIEGSTISTNHLFNNIVNFATPCEIQIIENVPMCLFDKFNIIHYPKWGEVVMFNHDKLKSELLDTCMISSFKGNMETSYKEILDIIEKFPNKYNMLSEKIIHELPKKPVEITREEDRILNLRETDDFKILLEQKREIETNKPNPEEEGVYIIENGRHIKGPNYDAWKRRHNEWVSSYKTWFSNLEQDYKLCFKACFEKKMRLEYINIDYDFPGFIMYINMSDETRLLND